MDVKVRLFALARQKAGRSEVSVVLPEPATVRDLRAALAETFPELAPMVQSVLIAVAAEYADDDQPITPGSELAVIPPVSGGSTWTRNDD
ncbi:MAG: MoaD/ThiS family protein [Isosphaeraceae bacterium]